MNSRAARLSALLICLVVMCSASGLSWQTPPVDWQQAKPGYSWDFPRDHWAHPGYRLEWWYFTGHLRLEGEERPRFGYQFTFYRVGMVPEQPQLDSDWATRSLIMGHAAVSDLQTGQHLFSELVYRAVPLLGGFDRAPGPRIAWSRAPAGSQGQWELAFNGEAFDFRAVDQRKELGFELSTRPLKSLILQGPGGFSRKGSAAASSSYYYSFTRLGTRGTLSWQGRTFQVEGESWMDHEFSSSVLGEKQVGWDWFSLQLQDGWEVMLYQLRDRSGRADFGRGTIIRPDGEVTYLDLSDWTLQVQRSWRSPSSGGRYPVEWAVTIPRHNLRLRVASLLDDQENRSGLLSGLDYWEGAVEVFDASGGLGRGYLEMTGYGRNSRPPI